MKFATLTIIAILAAASRLFAGPRATTAPTPPAFPIGVWQQDQAHFAVWQARGVNTLVQIPTGATWTPAAQAQWVADAEAAGLWQIRVPIPSPAADAAAHLMAWAQPDEPEDGSATSAACLANYANWKQVQPTRKVFLNFDGSRVLGIQGGLTQASYAPYLPAADLFASDIYPVTAWGRVDWLDKPALAASTLGTWTAGRPQHAFIETSNQRIGPSGTPTAAQVRYEAWHAVMQGATGIDYFPCQISPFAFDSTNPDVAAMLPVLNAEFAAIGPYLGTGLHGSSLAGGFEYGEVKTGANQLNVLLNATANAQAYSGVQLAPWGAYAVLVTPTGNKVLVQTPIPVPLDQQVAALQSVVNQQAATIAAQGQQIAQQAATIAAIAKAAAGSATQP